MQMNKLFSVLFFLTILQINLFGDANVEQDLMSFSFIEEDLVNIINKMAQKKKINVIFPQGPQAIQQKITFEKKEKVSIEEAWKLLFNLLELSGYTMVEDPKEIFTVVKVDGNITREVLPAYISTTPDNLPATDQRIRYIAYLRNIKVPENNQTNDPLTQILKDYLTINGIFLYDPKTNGIIVSDSSNAIRNVMKIIFDLDSTGYKEILEVIQLYYASAGTVAKLFGQLIPPAPTDGRFPVRSGPKTESSVYFASGTKIISDDSKEPFIYSWKRHVCY